MTGSKIDYGHYVDDPVEIGGSSIRVQEGEAFKKIIVLRSNEDSVGFDHIVVNEGGHVEVCVIVLPGVSTEINLKVDIIGRGAEVRLYGAYICGGEEKVAFHTDVRHRVPECTSEQTFNGIAGGSAKADFYGRIIVAPDAQKTEAYQSNRNLQVTSGARITTKPQLEIYADDVKCSHGATIGRLDESEQFYMRSRGIPEHEAKVLQMISFLAPVTSKVPELSEEIEGCIRGIQW